MSVETEGSPITGTRIDPAHELRRSQQRRTHQHLDYHIPAGLGNSTERCPLASSTPAAVAAGIANFGAGGVRFAEPGLESAGGDALAWAAGAHPGVQNLGVDISGSPPARWFRAAVTSGSATWAPRVGGVHRWPAGDADQRRSGGSGKPSIIDAAIAELRHLNPLNIVNLGQRR